MFKGCLFEYELFYVESKHYKDDVFRDKTSLLHVCLLFTAMIHILYFSFILLFCFVLDIKSLAVSFMLKMFLKSNSEIKYVNLKIKTT